MNREFKEEELLQISGIQHFVFCRRQWALMYIEQQWADNTLTIDGKAMHDRVDDPFFREVRKGVISARSIPLSSYTLGITGVCDLVELIPADQGISLPGRSEKFRVIPIEYKHGTIKHDSCDEAQLCAQALCLEEMLCTQINMGEIYYGKINHRVEVYFSDQLRELVQSAVKEMHQYAQKRYTPKVRISKGCKSCSLMDYCLPSLLNPEINVDTYIQGYLHEGSQ